MNTIDLDAILDSMYTEDNGFDIDCPGAYQQALDTAKELARRAVHQALVLAGDKAVIGCTYRRRDGEVFNSVMHTIQVGDNYGDYSYRVDKQSILDIEKLLV